MTVTRKIFIWITFVFTLMGCQNRTAHHGENNSSELPILSPKTNGEYVTISPFEFTNQYGEIISQKNAQGKVYLAEFFFTSCPSICPLVTKQLQHVFETFENESDFMILSHTIDPDHDTVSELKNYYTTILGKKKASNWQLLTGNKKEIYDLANFSYGSVVFEDKEKFEDNIMHSGALLLIDQNRLIRGMYDGRDSESTERLIKDIQLLLKQKK